MSNVHTDLSLNMSACTESVVVEGNRHVHRYRYCDASIGDCTVHGISGPSQAQEKLTGITHFSLCPFNSLTSEDVKKRYE